MAATCVLYRPDPEKIDYPLTRAPAEPLQNYEKTEVQAFAQNTNLRASIQGLPNVACNLPVEEALYLEIYELYMATIIIDQTFHDIGRKLSNASKEQNKRVDLYNTCHGLETQWDELHMTFKKLLWRSREFAGEAQGVVDDFREVVLPSLRTQNKTSSEKKEIIDKQLEVLQSISQPSQDLCDEFLNFSGTLDTFVDEFSQVVESLDSSEQSRKVKEQEDGLRSARVAMKIVNKEVKELGRKFAADIAVTGISLLLGFVIPTWWAHVANGVAIYINYMNVKHSGPQFFEAWSRWRSAVKEYEAKRVEYELERACLGQMERLESALHDSKPRIQEVTMKLGIFADVWAAIKADVQKLKSSLHRVEDSTSLLFTERVERLEKLYGYFSQALHHYQVTVRPPDTLTPF